MEVEYAVALDRVNSAGQGFDLRREVAAAHEIHC